ncbi:RNB-domain-containing protein [Wallemia mellicola]|nr:RNB-domain-containing protein [Wallemia mellicola]
MDDKINILKRPYNHNFIKTFIKKSNKGQLLKLSKEVYTRDDIDNGLSTLSTNGITDNVLFNNPHYLLPDTNVLLSQIDLFESGHFKDVIILQTVLDEVKHNSIPLFNRYKQLVLNSSDKFFIFYNEFSNFTHSKPLLNESPNDFNDRLIRSAASYFNSVLSNKSIVLLTNDVENLKLAQTDGITSSSIQSYIKGFPNNSTLQDLVADFDSSSINKSANSIFYQDYLPLSTLQAGLKSKNLFQGQFNANTFNYLQASVNVRDFDKPILLLGKDSMNRSIQDDQVVIQLLPKSQWKSSSDQVIDDDENDLNPAEQILSSDDNVQPTGKVVGIIKRQWRSYVCHLDKSTITTSSNQSQQTVFVSPIDRRIPKIKIKTRQASNLIDQKVVVAIDQWNINSRYPQGHFVRALGKVESKEAEIESLLLEYDVPYRAFSKSILNCLPPEGESWTVPSKDSTNPIWKDRVDLRDEVICSIDPPGCTDIDDALHAKYLPNGNIEAGVHIADVSHFVHPDTTMDLEAASRGTTVYLVDKRIDMLPSLLGTNLCSLRPHVERLAFSVIWELNSNAEIVDIKFHKSVIASKSAFTYEEAQLRKDDKSLNDPLTVAIRLLNHIAIQLKQKRLERGALDLASPEVKIHLDSSESTEPIDVEQKESKETNKLVEEFMLLANCTVATKINETFPGTSVLSILRRHLPPPKQNFEGLQEILFKRKNLNLDVSSSGALAKSLDNCVDKQEGSFNTLVRIMATRCMLSAEYFCSGSVSKETFSHYGLAAPIYTHFTSPIRRYADILAHRQLSAAINYQPLHNSLHNKSYVESIMDNINKRHRLGQHAGRASVEFYVALAIKARNERQGGFVREKAHVIRTFRNGLAVFIPTLGLEGLITFKKPIEFISEDFKIIVQDASSNQHTISVFDVVDVEIFVENDKNTQRSKLKMVLKSPLDSTNL